MEEHVEEIKVPLFSRRNDDCFVTGIVKLRPTTDKRIKDNGDKVGMITGSIFAGCQTQAGNSSVLKTSNMEEHAEEIKVPLFSRRKDECFVTGIVKHRSTTGSKYEWEDLMSELSLFRVTVYPDGDKTESKGYVSIVFDVFGFIHDVPYRLVSLQCTVSVVDGDGEPRFAKSFGLNARDVREGREEWDFLPPVELERFIRRSVLLKSQEDLLPQDTLTLRCDIIWWYDSKLEKKQSVDHWRNVCARTAHRETWFIGNKKSDDGHWLLDLSNAESQLCTRLRRKSDYFEALFRWPCTEMKDGHLPIHRSEYSVFFAMLCCVRFDDNNLQHIESIWECCDVYEMANRYGVTDLQVNCSTYLKRHLTYGCAIKALRVAGLCCDAELRTAAFRLALSCWRDVRGCAGGLYADCGEIKELICAAKVLNLERGSNGDRLSDLAARQVLLSRERVKHSVTWSAFASEMPDLAKVVLALDSDWNTLDFGKNKPVVASSYDFYN